MTSPFSLCATFDIQNLPDEVLLKVFDNCSILERYRLRIICRRWHRLTMANVNRLIFKQTRSCQVFPLERDALFDWNHDLTDPLFLHEHICDIRKWTLKGYCIPILMNCLIKAAGKSLRTLFVDSVLVNRGNYYLLHLRTKFLEPSWKFSDNDYTENIFQVLVDNCPNITRLRFSGESSSSFTHQEFEQLMRKYGHQLEELMFFKKYNYYDNFFRDTLVKHANKNRLRRLCFSAPQQGDQYPQFMKLVCNTFPHLTLFHTQTVSKVRKPCRYALDCKDSLKSLKQLQSLSLYNWEPTLDWSLRMPIEDWKKTLVGLELVCNKNDYPDDYPLRSLSFLQHLTSLRKLAITCSKNDHLELVVSLVPIELQTLSVYWESFQVKLPTLPDLSRLNQLIRLNIFCPGPKDPAEVLMFDDQQPLLSLRVLCIPIDHEIDSQYAKKYFERMKQTIFPNLENLGSCFYTSNFLFRYVRFPWA